MATGIKVQEVMRKGIVTVKKTDSAEKAAKIMKLVGIGGLIVTEKEKIVGILTEGDLIKDVIARGKNPKKVGVGDIMKHPVRTITPDVDLEEAAEIMRDLKIERLPVIEDGKMIGLITERDMIQTEPALLELMQEKATLTDMKMAAKHACIAGSCEECGNYSECLEQARDGRLLCDECR